MELDHSKSTPTTFCYVHTSTRREGVDGMVEVWTPMVEVRRVVCRLLQNLNEGQKQPQLSLALQSTNALSFAPNTGCMRLCTQQQHTLGMV